MHDNSSASAMQCVFYDCLQLFEAWRLSRLHWHVLASSYMPLAEEVYLLLHCDGAIAAQC